MPPVVGYNRYPDEKGTESVHIVAVSLQPLVTTVTPMKRGLKDYLASVRATLRFVTTVTPMKRGLKASSYLLATIRLRLVTTVTPMKRGLKGFFCRRAYSNCGTYFLSYNRYPDEKGTESIHPNRRHQRHYLVTTVTPMKRGLKGTQAGTGIVRKLLVTTVTPMKRGLKG